MKQVVEFLTLLHENNDKAWFDSHKEMYKQDKARLYISL